MPDQPIPNTARKIVVDCEVPVMLEPWVMRSTSSLVLLQGPLRAREVAPDRAFLLVKSN